MKIVKIFVSIVVVLLGVALIVAAVIDSEYALTREIAIERNKSDVFSYVKLLKNQSNYSTWTKMDPDMKKTFRGTDGTVGFVSAWSSQNEKVGVGEQEITKIVDGERVESILRFFEPFEANDSAYMTTEVISDNQTKVTWGFSGTMPYPMNLMLLMVDMEKEIGSELAASLSNLKALLENK